MPMEIIVEIGKYASAVLAIVAIGGWISRLIKIELKPIQEIKEATRLSLQYTITRAHEEYKRAGSISTYSLRCLTDLYTQYKALGGNSFIDALIAEIKQIPMSMMGDETKEGK